MHSSNVTASPAPIQPASAQPPLIIFAGGGSGGHLFPGLAIAERLTEVVPSVEVLFLCSDRRIDESILTKAGVAFVPLPAQPLGLRPFPAAPLRFARGWTRSVSRALAEISDRAAPSRPAAVALMGGFVAAPAARAARKLGVPSILINLDVAPGKANRLIARMATRIVSAVACPAHPKFAAHIVGMPIRRSAVASETPSASRSRLELDPDRSTLLITGASQGAGTFNRLLTDLIATKPNAFASWQVLHLTGELDYDEVARAYDHSEVQARVMPFCTDMASAWGAADLALSRCGASSVAEALANRVPTLFSPYPWHRDQHQRLNAMDAVRAGHAWLVDDAIDPRENLETMGDRLLALMADAPTREAARASLAARPPQDAALRCASLLLEQAGIDRQPAPTP